MKKTRREFISDIAAAGVLLPVADRLSVPVTNDGFFPVRLFSKPLDGYDFDFICGCLKGSGINGFELTVRKGGFIEPSEVEILLPELTGKARKKGLQIDMIVSDITSAYDPLTEKVLMTASSLGIKNYRLGYFDYEEGVSIPETLKKLSKELKKIDGLNHRYGITGGYQNHAGARVGGPVWDLYEILKDISPGFTGIQYDVRHAMVEGSNCWITGMRLVAPFIKTLAIKDFTWKNVNGRPQAVTVPLGEGMVNWDLFFRTVRELGIVAPVTLHIEYPLLEKGEEKLSLAEQQERIVVKLRKDMDFLESYMKKYQLDTGE